MNSDSDETLSQALCNIEDACNAILKKSEFLDNCSHSDTELSQVLDACEGKWNDALSMFILTRLLYLQ